MSEELQDAAYTLPRILTAATAINGGLMFIMCITFCYTLGDGSILTEDTTGYSLISLFYQATGSFAATNAMTSIVIILSFFTCITIMAGSSRQLFAFARDRALPFSSWATAVRPGYDVPVNSVLTIFGLAVVLSLINIGSTLAFSIITSLGTGTLTLSYIITIGLVVWRKITGRPPLPSRFNMGKIGGLVVNMIALLWMIIVLIFCFFPLFPDPTPALMNWAIVVWGGVIIFAILFFVLYARTHYAGPVEYVRKLE
ncbi:hypothetical protein LTR09_005314 [Extremus antarcticus]|uniref:Amino acid permease n=1 Tax=Extremus antarcticus TaxID=702011 RepID=A0AAJ0DP55_9PEZI|nr:hypothetical protein LTR09_005314 [Extremus antarcticus]